MMRRREMGGVSIFIVIFTALLLTVATTSFVQLMIRNQEQATTNDLSQSAYDAALAGVEDAKRALVALAKCEKTISPSCDDLKANFAKSQDCQFLGEVHVVEFDDDHEVKVGAEDLNQAYTCVKIKTDNLDYRGNLDNDSGGTVIRLKGNGKFDKVRISWFSNDDLIREDAGAQMVFPTVSTEYPTPLLATGAWNPDSGHKSPPILRAQLIQFKKKNIDLANFNRGDDSDAHTAFLYPYNTPGVEANLDWGHDDRTTNKPMVASCDPSGVSGYYCQATLAIPDLGSDDAGVEGREMYLQLAAIYGSTRYSVELFDDNKVVSFDGQQAIVDATGRAANLFRRVSARVSIKSASLNYPEAALSVKNNLCKNFFITDKRTDYEDNRNKGMCDN